MVIKGQDNRILVNENDLNVEPFDSVVAIDSRWLLPGLTEERGAIGSGIVIGPNHILTNHHVIYFNYLNQPERARVTLAQDVPFLSPRSTNNISDGEYNVEIRGEDEQSPIFAISGAKPRAISPGNLGEDVGIYKLKSPIADTSKQIGLIMYTNPQDLVGLDISTAGYPGVVRARDLLRSNNSPFISNDINGNPIVTSSDVETLPQNFLQKWLHQSPLSFSESLYHTDATQLFAAAGTIESATDDQIQLSSSIDLDKGQSGSGIWTILDGDSEPRVLGVLAGSVSGFDTSTNMGTEDNFGALINKQIYDGIIKIMEDSDETSDGNDLPENAIVGSDSLNDSIEGSYRKERILGKDGNDSLFGGDADDRLEGGDGNDVLKGEKGDDLLTGGVGDDELYGGEGDNDVAVFSKPYAVLDEETGEYISLNYDYSQDENGVITVEDISDNPTEGKDTLRGIEWARFIIDENSSTQIPSDQSPINSSRLLPLPLEDGVQTTEYISAVDTTVNPNPNDSPTPPYISLTAPVAMLDGDIDYTLNISPYEPSSEYNVVYVIDTSASIDATELQTIKNAYTDLTNFYINEGIAENINFGVVSYDSSGRFYPDAGGDRNLTADEALVALQNLTIDTGIGTRYYDGLNQADQFLLNSHYNPFFTTSIGYFFTDGQNSGDRLDMLLKARDVRELANFQAIGYYSDLDTLTSNSLQIRDVNWIDSNQGVFIDNIGDLSSQLLTSDLVDDVESVNILLDGEVVATLTPDQFTDSPLGLTYEGELDELDVSIDAENVISAEVIFTPESNFATTTVEHTVTAGEGEVTDADGNPIDESGNGSGNGNEEEDPFEKNRNGGDSDDSITLGYVDRGANGGAGGDYIIGNNRDNILDGGAGDDTILGHGGDDTITPGEGREKVDGGEGIDTVLYGDVTYQDNGNIFLRRAGNTVSYNSTDSLSNIEYLQFSDVRLDAETLEVAPIVEVEDITIVEGNSDTSLAQFTFNLDTPATAEVTFNYSTEDISATADSDYLPTSP